MKTPCLFAILILACGVIAASAQDSIPTQELDEFVVVAERQWIEDGVINVVPTKQEKNLSNSPASLVGGMNLPYLKEKDGRIVTMTEEPVEIFINGRKATEIDIMNFWPKDVKIVQYLENPKDPTFEGARWVVNFKTAEYSVGGVTKIDGFEVVTTNGDHSGYYTATSKFSYKRMTYGVLFSGDYTLNTHGKEYTETHYSDLYYKGVHYDEISRTGEGRSYQKNDAISAAVNANYDSDNFGFTQTLSFAWNRNPGSGISSSDIWSVNLFDSPSVRTFYNSKSVSPQYRGDYWFKFSDKWWLNANTGYAYAQNSNTSESIFGDSPSVSNGTKESVNTLKLSVVPSFILSDKWTFQFETGLQSYWYSTQYSGSAHVRQNQSRLDMSAAFKIHWNPLTSLRLYLNPGISTSSWKIGNETHTQVNPVMGFYCSWTPQKKLSLTGSVDYYMSSPSASETNPVMVRMNELMWTKGDAMLDNYQYWNASVRCSYLPHNWLSMALRIGFSENRNQVIPEYSSAPDNIDGLLKHLCNAPNNQTYSINYSIQGAFFNNKLSVRLNPLFSHQTATWGYWKRMSMFRLFANASFTIGDFKLMAYYEGPVKTLTSAGTQQMRRTDHLSFGAVYGNGNFYASIGIDDIFHDFARDEFTYISDQYSDYTKSFNRGRTIYLNLSYTFGYGKRLDHNINISGPENSSSSVLKTY